jgi:lysophospholipase L1-like esterase
MAGEPTRRRRSDARGLAGHIALAAAALLVTLGCVEIALRSFGPDRTEGTHDASRADGLPDAALYVRRPDGGVALRADAKVVVHGHAVSGRRVEIRTNALGFRGAPLGPRPPGVRRIAVLGDSVTFGDYVDEDETFPAALEAALRQRDPRVEVMNAGVGSIGVPDLPPLLESALAAEPDLVLVALYLNDAEPSLFVPPPAAWTRGSRLAALVEQRIAQRRVERAFRARMAARQPALDAFLAAHPIDPDADPRRDPRGFDREVVAAFTDWGYAWSPAAWREIEAGMSVLRDRARAANVAIAAVLLPVRLQVEASAVHAEPQALFAAAMERLGIPHADVLPALRREASAGAAPLYYDHCHYTPRGNRVVAAAIAAWLGSQPGS